MSSNEEEQASGSAADSSHVPLTVAELPTVFADLTPDPQDDGPDPVCRIDYKPDFVTAYDYLRACWQSQTPELSERAFRLTQLCLQLNPSNYTVWQYRRQILRELYRDKSADIKDRLIRQDFDFCASLGGDNPKNYQLWYHRRALLIEVDALDAYASDELDYIATVLSNDGKNYHAWSHRQWLVTTVAETATDQKLSDLWNGELTYTDSLLQTDVRNNSAWNHRWFVVHHDKTCLRNAASILTLEAASKEIDYANAAARVDANNESPWRYLVALVQEQLNSSTLDATQRESLLDGVLYKIWEVEAAVTQAGGGESGETSKCPSLLSATVDILELKGDALSLEAAKEIVKSLAEEHDRIREKYWTLRGEQLADAILKVTFGL